MSVLTSTKLREICPDSWVARAYGEYMSDCAQAQADLIAAVTDAISDSSLDQILDTAQSRVANCISTITSSVYEYMARTGTTDPSIYSTGSNEFRVAIGQIFNSSPTAPERATIESAYWTLHDYYPDIFTHNVMQDVMNLCIADTDQVVDSIPSVQAAFYNAADAACQRADIPANASYCLNEAYISYRDLIKNVTELSNLNLNKPFANNFKDINGNALSSNIPELHVDEVILQLKESFCSCVAWAQGFLSLESSSLTEALAKFEANVDSIVSDVKEKFASTVLQVKSLLANTNANVSSFISQASEWLGWNKVVDETFVTVDDTDIFSYTGASPMAGVSLKTAKGIAQTTGKAILAAGAAIWFGVKSLAKKLWKKAQPFVKALTSDPIDIEYNDKNDQSFAIGNFMFNYSEHELMFDLSLDPDDPMTNILESMISRVSDSWYAIQTYFFECCFKMTNISLLYGASTKMKMDVDIKFRPRCINVNSARDYGLLVELPAIGPGSPTYIGSAGNIGGIDVWSRYQKFINAGDIRYDDITNEKQMFMSFISSFVISDDALAACFKELNDSFNTAYGFKINSATTSKLDNDMNPLVNDVEGTVDGGSFNLDERQVLGFCVDEQNPQGWTPTTITNRNFIGVCSGYCSEFRWIPTVIDDGSGVMAFNCSVTATVLVGKLIGMLLLQQFDRLANPTDYVFLPYCKGSYDFSSGRYHIKTDAQNANLANIMINAIIVILVVAAGILICKSVLKIWRTKRIAKMSNYLGQQDNAIWTGNKTLSYFEQRKYLRYSRKISKMTDATSGLIGSASASSIMTSAVGSIKNKVMTEVDIPRSIATGSWVARESSDARDNYESLASDISNVKDLITG